MYIICIGVVELDDFYVKIMGRIGVTIQRRAVFPFGSTTSSIFAQRPSSIFHKHFDAFSHMRSHPMGEALGVANALFDAAVGALDGVTIVRHGFAGGFVDEFELVAEGGREEGVVDDDDMRRQRDSDCREY